MKMVPNSPYSTTSRAEEKVYDKLKRVNIVDPKGEYYVYHSLNLPNHKTKIMGEIDFLICGPKGIFAIEVKGGGVQCKDGEWHFTNRHGNVARKREGPFEQARTAMFALKKDIGREFGSHIANSFSYGYGVIFPDCRWAVESSEWEAEQIADLTSMRNFDRWINDLIAYWRNKPYNDTRPLEKDLMAVQSYLRPAFESAVPLFVQAEDIQSRIVQLTEDQMRLVDIVSSNDKVLCTGGAGTGKTFVAMELARRWSAGGENVLVVCKSTFLKCYLDSHFNMENVFVTTIDSLKTTVRRSGIEQFDSVIVDEGQDLFQLDYLDAIEERTQGGLSNGKWCWFYDLNNQAGLFGTPDLEALDFLKSFQPATIPLSTNCRNTKVILDKVKATLGADMGVNGAGSGPEVEEIVVKTAEESAETLQKVLIEVINRGGLHLEDVVILSSQDFENSSVSKLPSKWLSRIRNLDEFSMRDFPSEGIGFSNIRDFKGLESDAVIVIDLPPPSEQETVHPFHYVAMSRARSLLYLIYRSN